MRPTLTLVATTVVALALSLPVAAAAATYEIDPVHSSAIFKIKHFDTSYFYGAFKEAKGTVQYDAANPGSSSIDLTITADSVDSRNANRDEHIKSPDFLNAKQFPVITFKSKSVKGTADQLEITGTLTLHGVSKDITVKATKTGTGTNPRSQKELIGFHSEFTVKRSDFDMEFMLGPLADELTFILSLEAGKQ